MRGMLLLYETTLSHASWDEASTHINNLDRGRLIKPASSQMSARTQNNSSFLRENQGIPGLTTTIFHLLLEFFTLNVSNAMFAWKQKTTYCAAREYYGDFFVDIKSLLLKNLYGQQIVRFLEAIFTSIFSCCCPKTSHSLFNCMTLFSQNLIRPYQAHRLTTTFQPWNKKNSVTYHLARAAL